MGRTAWRDRVIRAAGYRLATLHIDDWDAACAADASVGGAAAAGGAGSGGSGGRGAAVGPARAALLARLIQEAHAGAAGDKDDG
jgi:hypothetical protein